jgi:site-specific recombinase XerC
VALDLADYDAEAGTLRVRGKRNKKRLAHVVNDATRALGDWLNIRRGEPGPLFWPVRKGGRVTPGRLTTQAIYNILRKRAGQECRLFAPLPDLWYNERIVIALPYPLNS